MREITEVIYHHTLSGDVSASRIDEWHRARGWDSIGYHYVIRFDGTIEKGRNLGKKGAHAKGRNGNSIGVAFCGDFNQFAPSKRQLRAGAKLHKALETILCKKLKVGYHHEKCPAHKFNREDFTEACNA